MKNVSIIVPTYNSEKTLNRCIDALINQTYADIEIICVNDGSKDNTLAILEEYSTKDDRVIVINQENSGPALARFNALAKASGKYIMFCDDDDWYESEMVEQMVEAIESQNADLVMCDCNNVDLMNGQLQTENYKLYNRIKLKGKHKIKENEVQKINVLIWNKIFKKEIIDKYNVLYPKAYEHDDVIFLYKYLAHAKTYYGLDIPLYNYVIGNPDSIMGRLFLKKNNESKFDFIYSWQDLFDYLNEYNSNEKYLKAVVMSSYRKIVHFYRLLDELHRKEAFEKIKSFILKNTFLKKYKNYRILSEFEDFESFNYFILYGNVNFLQKVFSVKNSFDKKYKIIRILGLELFKERKQSNGV